MPAMKKKGMGAVIDVLAAKVPQVEAHRAFEMLKVNVGPDKVKFDSVGCRNLGIIVQVSEPTSELCFTNTTVTQDENFQFSVQCSPGFEIVEVSADFADDVCSKLLSANLGWKVVEPAIV